MLFVVIVYHITCVVVFSHLDLRNGIIESKAPPRKRFGNETRSRIGNNCSGIKSRISKTLTCNVLFDEFFPAIFEFGCVTANAHVNSPHNPLSIPATPTTLISLCVRRSTLISSDEASFFQYLLTNNDAFFIILSETIKIKQVLYCRKISGLSVSIFIMEDVKTKKKKNEKSLILSLSDFYSKCSFLLIQ